MSVLMFKIGASTLIVFVLYLLNREELWNRNAHIAKSPRTMVTHE